MIENLLLPVNFVMTLDPFAALPALGVFGGLAFCMMFLDLIRINIKPPTYFFLGQVKVPRDFRIEERTIK